MFATTNFKHHHNSATAMSATAAASFCICALMDSVILTESIFVCVPLICVLVLVLSMQVQP